MSVETINLDSASPNPGDYLLTEAGEIMMLESQPVQAENYKFTSSPGASNISFMRG